MRLHPRDAVYLYFDRPQRDAHVMFGSLLETPEGFSDDDVAMLRRRVRAAFASAERLHSRLVRVPFHLGYPIWQPVESPYDLSPHVTVHPDGSSWDAARDLLSDIVSRPMDLTRPLWHMHVIPGIHGAPSSDGRTTLIATSIHHSAFDGISFARAMSRHFIGPENVDRSAEAGGDVSDSGLSDEGAFLGHHTTPVRAERPIASRLGVSLRDVARLPRDILRFVAAIGALIGARFGSDARATPGAHPAAPRGGRSRFGSPAGGRRRVGFLSVPFDTVSALRAAVPGATLNDVVVGIVSDAARTHLTDLGEAPQDDLVVGVPVALHDSEPDSSGQKPTASHTNQFRPMLVPCPVGSESLAQRLIDIVAHTRRQKAAIRGADGDADPAEAVLFATPAVAMAVMGWIVQRAQQRLRFRAPVDMTLSSVPTPMPTNTVFGHKVSGRICVQSLYAPTLAHYWSVAGDRLGITVTTDESVVPSVDEYLGAVERSILAHHASLTPSADQTDADT